MGAIAVFSYIYILVMLSSAFFIFSTSFLLIIFSFVLPFVILDSLCSGCISIKQLYSIDPVALYFFTYVPKSIDINKTGPLGKRNKFYKIFFRRTFDVSKIMGKK